jgi:hypothetical protein
MPVFSVDSSGQRSAATDKTAVIGTARRTLG